MRRSRRVTAQVASYFGTTKGRHSYRADISSRYFCTLIKARKPKYEGKETEERQKNKRGM